MKSSNRITIEKLMHLGNFVEARSLIEQALDKQPNNHWLLTQLGVTYYEEGKYQESLRPFLSSLEIVPDCPLTLWNLAGALDACDKSKLAIRIFTWLLRSEKTADDDPCWESEEWADSLKADCVFRIGVCFQRLKRRESAENCFRRYIELLLAGVNGTYPMEAAAKHIRQRHTNGKKDAKKQARRAIDFTLRDEGLRSILGGRRKLPKLSVEELLASS